MKRALVIVAALLLFRSGSPAQGAFSFGVFYSSLDSYGEWITLDGGVYGWRPVHVVPDWRPYWMGRWAWTSDGWYWVSEEPWGWATYHYGRWYYDDFYGWIWIPGYDWAPAWVEWRYGGDCVGWAPLGPYAVWDFHFGLWYGYHWATPYHWWTFVDCRYINSRSLHQHIYRSEENRRFIGRTRDAGAVRYHDGRIQTRGPEREFVERRGGIRLERTEVFDLGERGERVTREGARERIGVFRPRIEDRQVDRVERPSRVREAGRRVRLEAGQTDVRVRSMGRSTAGENVKRGVVWPPERLSPGRVPAERSPRSVPPERSIERIRPDVPRDGQERVGNARQPRPADHPRQAPEVGRSRSPQEEMHGKAPEHPTVRPPEAPQEQRGGDGKKERR